MQFYDKKMKDTIVWEIERKELKKLLKGAFDEQKYLFDKYYKKQLVDMYGDDKEGWLTGMLLAIIDEYGEYKRMDDEWEKIYELVDVLHFIIQMAIISGVSYNRFMNLIEDDSRVGELRSAVQLWLKGLIDNTELTERVWVDFVKKAGDLLAVLYRHHIKAKENERRQKEGY
jgi:chemotaxis regulatin CheY-phosphate phosphatase CheZ